MEKLDHTAIYQKILKFFNINQLTIVEKNNSSKIKLWNSDFKENLYYESVSDFINKEIITLTQLGWYIANDKDQVFLYSKPNNRYLYSNNYADIWLVQQKHINKLKINNPNGMPVYGANKKMLWDVGGRNRNTKTYKMLDKAAGQFMNLARLLAPKLEDMIIYGN